MQRSDTLDERVDSLLRQVSKSAERRDGILESVSKTVSDTGSLSACMEEVRTVSRRMMPSFVDSSAGLAKTIAVSASLAERSSRRVKRLDILLRRVREAKVIADSLKEMRGTVNRVSEIVEGGDLETAVQLIRSFESARANLGPRGESITATPMKPNAPRSNLTSPNHHSSTDPSHADGIEQDVALGEVSGSPAASAEGVITAARESAREKLLEKFRAAAKANDKLTIMSSTRLLAQLGFHEEGCGLYCTWMCEHTIAALSKIVDRELRKMDDPTEAGMSHLALVSTALDVVVAAFEGEEEFARETFGDAGPLKLLTELHSKSTSQCVPVMKDFLKKRQEVLGVTSASESTGRSSSPVRNTEHGAAEKTAAADPRRTDQILEEMSHLVSCCHLYWAFAQSKQHEYTHGDNKDREKEQQHGAQTADSLWSSRDNPLMNTVQDILAVFVPVQKRYFNAAFDQALRLQMEALQPRASHLATATRTPAGVASSSGRGTGGHPSNQPQPQQNWRGTTNAPAVAGVTLDGNPASPSNKAAATFMTGLAAIYASTTGGVVSTASHPTDAVGVEGCDCAITLPDDVFFFLRIALHRAVNTKSTQIVSAVFMACVELVQTRMIPVMQRYASPGHRNTASGTTHSLTHSAQPMEFSAETLTPRALRWISATQCTATYASKLGDELRQLARANFTGRDIVRFVEQAEDMNVLTRDLRTALERWLGTVATFCYKQLAPHFERFAALSYNLTEEMFYHYELSDPWVQAAVAEAEVMLHAINEHLDPSSFDIVLLALVRRVVQSMWKSLTQKMFSAFGALQVDRDVRTLRAFFLGRAHEVPLREHFQSIASAASLLLLDNPRDAEHERAEGLSADEKRRILSCRVDFKREEIARLRL